jgi:serine phosphatase RsbU (regulator of sigma subunit)
LQERNRQLQRAYDELKAAQAELIEKERLDHELKVAAQIQISMLPQSLPSVQGFDFGALMQPARTVGGDFFDVFLLDSSHVGVVVGDVVGKGVPAAIFMARCHALIMSESIRGGSPADILRRVNSHLIQLHQSDHFVTALLGILDVANGEFRYARAGHDLPILLTSDGSIQTLPMRAGQPLGLFDEALLDENSLRIPPGATLLLNTDGLTDCRSPDGEQFEQERVEQVLATLAGCSGQKVCQALLEKLMNYQSGAEQDDDITLVALHRAGT